MIEPVRGQTHMWPSICQDWGAITLGSLDVSLREVACSPSNLTSRGRCVIAILNSNAEVSLWAAAKNHLKGEWSNIQDVTGLLLNKALSKDVIRNTLRAQVTSLAWSKQPDYRITPTPILDSSMLALGNRAGCIEFFRFNGNSNPGGSLSYIHTEPLSDHWITHLSWAPWITHAVGHCKLSCGYRMNGIFITAKANPYWPSPLIMAMWDWSKSHNICSLLRVMVLCPSTRPVLHSTFKVQYTRLINEA